MGVRRSTSLKVRPILAAAFSTLLGVALIVSGTLAQGENLNDKKNATQTKINANKQEISQAEAKLKKAQEAVNSTQKKLADAQADLAEKQKATQEAKAKDTRLAASLADAQKSLSTRMSELAEAQAAVAQGEADLASQRDTIGLLAQATAQQSQGLLSLAILFTDFDTGDINNRLQWANSAFMASQKAMDDLLAAQALFEASQAKAQAAEEAAAKAEKAAKQKRAEAAAQLQVTRQVQAAAQQAENNVSSALADNKKAKDDAATALAQAKAEQKQLEAELAKIQAEIKAQIAAQKKKSGNKSTPSKPAPRYGSFFYRPVPGRVTSTYGWRMHPILHYKRFHQGVDFGGSCGTPIRAAESGTVTRASYFGGWGNYVSINHGKIGGKYYTTGYGHMSKFAVRSGQKVSRGQVIGYIGTTGMSTGCHLHWNVFRNGNTMNGLNLL